MANTIIELPQVGESVTEGVISKWLVQPGQKVRKYDPLVEVMTDKVNMEVPSPYTGTLVKTLAAEGDTIPMGQPIAEMDVEGATPAEAPASAPFAHPEPVEGRPQTRTFEFVDSVRSVGPTGSGEGGQGRPDALQDAAIAAASAPQAASAPAIDQRLSPIVKRLVAQHGVDVSKIKGTGVGGRITKDDVLAYVESAHPEPVGGPAGSTPSPSMGEGGGEGETPALQPTSAQSVVEGSTLPLTPLRKTIAAHMDRSAREIPAAWTMVEVDVTGLVAYRTANRDAFQRDHGLSLTYLPFAAKVIADALVKNPMLNGRWAGDHIALNAHVNLGVAVATDGGLIVPVIRNAETLSIADLAREAQRLAEAARAGSLKLDDVQGGTFTLDNTGALGSVVSVPIINHPQAAIITTEAIVKRPVVVAGDAIAVRSMMNVCLTFDHRVCDGAESGRFLADVKSGLEAIGPGSALL